MSFLSNIAQQVIYIYDARAQAVYAAAQAVAASRAQAGQLSAAQTASGAGKTTGPSGLVTNPAKRTFTLELYSATRVKSATSGVAVGGSGLPPVSSLTFDVAVSPSINGFAQRINYERRARQSIQQSLAGYHVNEFGLAPGSLDIEAIVIWSPTPSAQVQQFFDQLGTAKMSAPNSGDTPFTLRFHDSYLGRSYVITQDGVSLTQDADNPNRGVLRIQATILYDYSSGTPNVSPQSIGASLQVAQEQAQAALDALTAVPD
jgi:hypothetical protein